MTSCSNSCFQMFLWASFCHLLTKEDIKLIISSPARQQISSHNDHRQQGSLPQTEEGLRTQTVFLLPGSVHLAKQHIKLIQVRKKKRSIFNKMLLLYVGYKFQTKCYTSKKKNQQPCSADKTCAGGFNLTELQSLPVKSTTAVKSLFVFVRMRASVGNWYSVNLYDHK